MFGFLRLWIFPLLTAYCAANPIGIVIDEDLREEVIRMESEEVEMRIDPDSSQIKGTYHFSQPNPARRSEAAAVQILLPVYVSNWINPESLSELSAIYTPVISVGGTSYAPQAVKNGGSWGSFWRDAKFYRADFIFKLPAEVMTEKFVITATYKQPHMVARKKKYACYCPCIPEIGGDQNLRSSGPFILRAIATDQLKLKRVSKNKSVISESAQRVEVNCIDQDQIIVAVVPSRTKRSPAN